MLYNRVCSEKRHDRNPVFVSAPGWDSRVLTAPPLVLPAFIPPRAVYVKTQDPSLHPTDISLAWTVCDAVGCDFTPVTTDVVITCAGEEEQDSFLSREVCTQVVG